MGGEEAQKFALTDSTRLVRNGKLQINIYLLLLSPLNFIKPTIPIIYWKTISSVTIFFFFLKIKFLLIVIKLL